MKVELQTLELAFEPGFVIEGEDKQQIQEAVRKLFNGELPMGVWVITGAWKRAPDNSPSISAQDILNEEVGMEDLESLHYEHGKQNETGKQEASAA
jgi:hypothetical protein